MIARNCARPLSILRAAKISSFLISERIEFVEQSRGGKAQGRGGFARGPDVHQAVQRVLFHLQAILVTGGAQGGGIPPAEPAALVPNHRFDCREQLGGGHQPHRHARAAEHGLNDFAMGEIGDDRAVLDFVAADDATGGNAKIEHRVACRGKLMHEFARRNSAVEKMFSSG